MNARNLSASVVLMPDGRAYAASEESIISSAPTPQTHQLLAQYKSNELMDKNRHYKDDADESVLLNPTLSGALKQANGPAMYQDGVNVINSLSAADGVANSDNLTHLQLIRLFPQIQGAPDVYFFLENAFVKREISMLEYRESFYDTVQTAEYLDRLEQSKATNTKYDEIKYDLKKLVDKVYTPIEDIYRTIINPQTIDLAQIYWGFKRKRNLSALAALKKIGNPQGGLVGKFEKITGTGNDGFHSANHGAKELNVLFNTFLKTNDVSITHVVMNPQLFTEYTENTWTKSGPVDMSPVRLAGGGVVPLPGINGITAIVDVHVPDNKIYAINKPNAMRLGEGPKLMRRYYDEERDASAIKMIDFHEHISVNDQIKKLDRKFGMTLTVNED